MEIAGSIFSELLHVFVISFFMSAMASGPIPFGYPSLETPSKIVPPFKDFNLFAIFQQRMRAESILKYS